MMVTILFVFAVLNPDVGYRQVSSSVRRWRMPLTLQGMHELLAVCLLAVDRDSLEYDSHDTVHSSAQAVGLDAMRTALDRRWVEHDSFGLFQEIMRGAKAFYEWRAEEGPVSGSIPVLRLAAEVHQRTKVPQVPQAPIILRCQQLHNSLLRRIDPQLWERFETESLEPQIWAM
jgi:TBC1 domain family protein 5